MMDKSLLEWQVERILKETSREVKARNMWCRILEEAVIALVVVGVVAGMCWLCRSIRTPAVQEQCQHAAMQEAAEGGSK